MPSDSVYDEPHLRSSGARLPASDKPTETVWDEPALQAGGAAPPPSAITYAGRLQACWRQTSWAGSWWLTLGIALAAGPFAVLVAFLKTWTFASFGAAIFAAPLTEELAKVAVPLIFVETRPHRFLFAIQPWAACLISGLVFSVLENLLYIHIYMHDAQPDMIAFRWTVCTAVHLACSGIAGLGVRRVWLRCRETLQKPEPALAASYLIVAMVLHGLYNAITILHDLKW